MKENRTKCVKCGSSPADNPTVRLHRFPQPNKANKSRCELWAKFCFPNDAWQSPQFQTKLFTEHKMLCDKHFKSTSQKNQLAKCLLSEKELNKNKKPVDIDEMEVVIIKNEPNDDIAIQEHRGQEQQLEEHQTETRDIWDTESSKTSQDDDCQLYGKLLTKKLRTYSVYERNLLMFKIDGLLIENPPGFKTSLYSFSMNMKNYNEINKTKQCSLKKGSPTSSTVKTSSTSQSKKEKKKLRKESQAVQMSPPLEESYTDAPQVTSTSMQTLSPVKINNGISNQPAYNTSNSNQPAKVTSSFLKLPVNSTSSIQYQPVKVTTSFPNQPIKVTSSIPYQPLKVTSSIPNQPVKVTSNSNQPIRVQASSSSLPSHLPLHITIPETHLVPFTQSKFVVSSTHPKGKIVIIKSRSNKYVPSSQAPILITVPSSSIPVPSVNFPAMQCEMNSLEQLSSIAVSHISQLDQHQSSFDSEESAAADDINVVSHEVVLSASTHSPSL